MAGGSIRAMRRHVGLAFSFIALVAVSVGGSEAQTGQTRPQPQTTTRPITDEGRLYEGHALEVASPTDIVHLQALVRMAARRGWKVSISGKRHSQGGQSFGDTTLQLDMLRYNRVLDLDTLDRVITVQSGATWKTVLEAANAHRLSVRVMQNSNIFTVGGSMSVNAHGPDPREGTIFGTVRAFRILCADGIIREANRTLNPDLFRLAIGGYGLFGVILDVDIELAGNAVYRRQTDVMNVSEYPAWFARHVRGNKAMGIHYAWLSIDPRSLLRETYSMSYAEVRPGADSIASLRVCHDFGLSRFLFGLSRRWDWAKGLRWTLQKWVGQPGVAALCTRNDVLSPNIDFLEYRASTDADILQEYFVPAERLLPFLDGMRRVCRLRRVNLLSATIRYLPASERPYLSYQRRGDSFGVVIYANVRRDQAGKAAAAVWTRELVDVALQQHGSYYLVYQLMPTREQLRHSYPEFDSFVDLKRKYDPGERFSSTFYRHYTAERR